MYIIKQEQKHDYRPPWNKAIIWNMDIGIEEGYLSSVIFVRKRKS